MHEFADLHVHSSYSKATAQSITPSSLLAASAKKGISVLGSGDALHPGWRSAWAGSVDNDEGILIVPSTEIEGNDRIHHLILMEDFEGFEHLADAFRGSSRNIDTGGRPHLALSGEEIADRVHALGGLIGPAHAFTPWTSLFAEFDRVRDCYGNEPIDFLELGLSADTSYAAGIPDLRNVPFVSFSDAHSATPLKIGREFTTLAPSARTVQGVLAAIAGGRIVENVGFFPEEGKYNRTACTRGYEQYTVGEAERYGWRCPVDGGLIKKGVRDRASELSTGDPTERPPYRHMIPLAEIVRRVLGVSSPYSKRCQLVYNRLLETLGTEIEVLFHRSAAEIREVHAATGDAIDALRHGRVTLYPGGGGKFGTFSFVVTERHRGDRKQGTFIPLPAER